MLYRYGKVQVEGAHVCSSEDGNAAANAVRAVHDAYAREGAGTVTVLNLTSPLLASTVAELRFDVIVVPSQRWVTLLVRIVGGNSIPFRIPVI